jgi:hypothetical protein
MSIVDLQLTQDEQDQVIRQGKSHVYKTAPRGQAGDTFTVGDRKFEIIDVSERPLKFIAGRYFRMEGYDSPAAILRELAARYFCPDPPSLLYIHWFREIDDRYSDG